MGGGADDAPGPALPPGSLNALGIASSWPDPAPSLLWCHPGRLGRGRVTDRGIGYAAIVAWLFFAAVAAVSCPSHTGTPPRRPTAAPYNTPSGMLAVEHPSLGRMG